MFKWIKSLIEDQANFRKLSEIKQAVDTRIEYLDLGVNEWRYVPKGTLSSGDCQVFTETYMQDCKRAGFVVEELAYKVSKDKWHVVCKVETKHGDYILDCMCKYPYRRKYRYDY